MERLDFFMREGDQLPTKDTSLEAVAALEDEMRSYYSNIRRVDYGPKIRGRNFAVDGCEDFLGVTHFEVKSPVSSTIPPYLSVKKQEVEVKVVLRTNPQRKFWLSPIDEISKKVPHVKRDAFFLNLKIVSDCLMNYMIYDIGTPEKPIAFETIMKKESIGHKFKFLNNIYNI